MESSRLTARMATTAPSGIEGPLPFPSSAILPHTKSSAPRRWKESWRSSHTPRPSIPSEALQAKLRAVSEELIPSLSLDESLGESLNLSQHSQVTARGADIFNYKDTLLLVHKTARGNVIIKTALEIKACHTPSGGLSGLGELLCGEWR